MEKIEIAEGEKIEIIPDIIGGTFTSSDENIVKITKTGDNGIIEGIGIGDGVITYDYTDKFQCVGQAKLDISVIDSCIQYFPKAMSVLIVQEMLDQDSEYAISVVKDEIDVFGEFINPYYYNENEYSFKIIATNGLEGDDERRDENVKLDTSMAYLMDIGYNQYEISCTSIANPTCMVNTKLLTCSKNQHKYANIPQPTATYYGSGCGTIVDRDTTLNVQGYKIVDVSLVGLIKGKDYVTDIDNTNIQNPYYSITTYTGECLNSDIMIYTQNVVESDKCLCLNIRTPISSIYNKYIDNFNITINGVLKQSNSLTETEYKDALEENSSFTFDIVYAGTSDCNYNEDYFDCYYLNEEYKKFEIVKRETKNKDIIITYEGFIGDLQEVDASCKDAAIYYYRPNCLGFQTGQYYFIHVKTDNTTPIPKDISPIIACTDDDHFIDELTFERVQNNLKVKFYYNDVYKNEDNLVIFKSDDNESVDYNIAKWVNKDESSGKTKLQDKDYICSYYEEDTCNLNRCTVVYSVGSYRKLTPTELGIVQGNVYTYKIGDIITYSIYGTDFVFDDSKEITYYEYEKINEDGSGTGVFETCEEYLNITFLENKQNMRVVNINGTSEIPVWFRGKDAFTVSVKQTDYCGFEETITFKFATFNQ